MADKARQVKKIIFIIQLLGPSLSKVFFFFFSWNLYNAQKNGFETTTNNNNKGVWEIKWEKCHQRGMGDNKRKMPPMKQSVLGGSFAKLCEELIWYEDTLILIFYFSPLGRRKDGFVIRVHKGRARAVPWALVCPASTGLLLKGCWGRGCLAAAWLLPHPCFGFNWCYAGKWGALQMLPHWCFLDGSQLPSP